jgi:outer membrane protein
MYIGIFNVRHGFGTNNLSIFFNMLKKSFILLITLMASAIISSSYGQVQQGPWSLEACINHALKNNIQIKQQVLTAQSSELQLIKSKADLFPSVNAGANQNFNWGRAWDKTTNQIYTQQTNASNFYISASVVLFNGMQNINSIKQNQFNLQAVIKDVEATQNNVALNVAATYLQILFNLENAVLAKEQLSITNLQVDRTKKLVDAGKLAQGSLFEINAQRATEELQVVSTQNDLELSYLTLTQMLDLPTKNGFLIVNPQLNIESKIAYTASVFSSYSAIDSIYQIALGNQPAVKSSELYVKVSETALSVAKGYYSPRLSAQANYGTDYASVMKDMDAKNSFSYQLKNNASTSLSFGLSIPIFNNLQSSSAVKNAKINLLKSQNNLQLAKNSIHKDIEDAYNKALASLNKYKATIESVKSNEEAFNYAQQKFDVGLINTVEYNTAKIKLSKAKSDLVQAKYDFVFRATILDFYMGKPIKIE